jgi:methyl-accepting chemotaxis protein
MKLNVAQKLAMGLGIMCLLALLPATYELWQFRKATRLVTIISTDDASAAQAASKVAVLFGRLRSLRTAALAKAAMSANHNLEAEIAKDRNAYFEAYENAAKSADELSVIATDRAGHAATPERGPVWQQLSNEAAQLGESLRNNRQLAEGFFRSVEHNQLQTAGEQEAQLEGLAANSANQIDLSVQNLRQLADIGIAAVQQTYDDVLRAVIVTFAAVLLGATAITFGLSRSINRRLSMAIAHVTRIGGGDLREGVSIPGHDEFHLLGRHLNEATTRLRDAARGTRKAAESVHAATAQIRASTQQQAASVAEQLAAVEQTMATLSEITESGAQISRRAQDVSQKAESVAVVSTTGMKALEDTLTAMESIREQSEAVATNIVQLSERTQAIGEIIITVNDIAERSHLVALNAAIEAAAAGEHGRSFAVVANEIKNLADQAKEATSQVRSNLLEIQHGINSSVMLTEEAVKRVTAGKKQTDSTQRTIGDMAENIRESVMAFQQIVAGTNQQQIGLEQVIQALQNIRQASTQTADGTRQLEEAATGLNQLGQQMVDAVRNYQV